MCLCGWVGVFAAACNSISLRHTADNQINLVDLLVEHVVKLYGFNPRLDPLAPSSRRSGLEVQAVLLKYV